MISFSPAPNDIKFKILLIGMQIAVLFITSQDYLIRISLVAAKWSHYILAEKFETLRFLFILKYLNKDTSDYNARI